MILIRLLLVFCLIILLPFLLGMGVFVVEKGNDLGRDNKLEMYARAYILGSLTFWSIYGLLVQMACANDWTNWALAHSWALSVLALTLFAVIIAVIKIVLKKVPISVFWRKREAFLFAVMVVVAVIITVVFRICVASSIHDYTAQETAFIYQYGVNAISKYNLYTGFPEEWAYTSATVYLDNYYVSIALIAGVTPTKIFRFILPVAFVLAAICAAYVLGSCLWPSDEKKQRVWMTVLGVVYCLFAISNRMPGLQLFATSWNGTAVWVSVFVPLMLYLCLDFLKREKYLIKDCGAIIFWIMMCTMAGNMFFTQNVYLLVLFVLFAVVAHWLRRFVYHD